MGVEREIEYNSIHFKPTYIIRKFNMRTNGQKNVMYNFIWIHVENAPFRRVISSCHRYLHRQPKNYPEMTAKQQNEIIIERVFKRKNVEKSVGKVKSMSWPTNSVTLPCR